MTDINRPPDGRVQPRDGETAAKLQELHDMRALLVSVRSTLATLLVAVQSGEADGIRDLVTKHKELETALKRIFDTERAFNDWYAEHTGGGAAGDIDLDDIRQQIGCRLARLRACCRE